MQEQFAEELLAGDFVSEKNGAAGARIHWILLGEKNKQTDEQDLRANNQQQIIWGKVAKDPRHRNKGARPLEKTLEASL